MSADTTRAAAEMKALEVEPWMQILTAAYRVDDPGPSLDVQLHGEAGRVRLRLRAGNMHALDPATRTEPDLAIHLSEISVRDALLGRAASMDLFGDARIETVDGRRRIAPLAETQIPAQAEFTRIPEASLVIGMHVTGSLAGEVGVIEDWQDGVLCSSRVVPAQELEGVQADVRMSISLAQLASLRRGEVTPLDALAAGMGLFGEWPQLMCWTELVQHPAYRSAWPDDPTLDAEAAWGSVFCSSAYGDAVTRALIERPVSKSVA